VFKHGTVQGCDRGDSAGGDRTGPPTRPRWQWAGTIHELIVDAPGL